jgi:hypothetical protein
MKRPYGMTKTLVAFEEAGLSHTLHADDDRPSEIPTLPVDKANLLALYNFRVSRLREIVIGPLEGAGWLVYCISTDPKGSPREYMILLSDSIERWMAEVAGWAGAVLKLGSLEDQLYSMSRDLRNCLSQQEASR